MQHVAYIERLSVLGSVVLIVAFVLTMRPESKRLTAAAVLYSAGFLASMAPTIYHRILGVQIGYGLTDSQPNRIALLLLVWPIWAVTYPIAAAFLLWPSIPRDRALRWGKLLHILIGLPPILIQVVSTSPVYGKGFGLSWVAYAVLWFRIRESYPTSPIQPQQ